MSVIEVPIEFLGEFQKNPRRALRDLAAIPTYIQERFFRTEIFKDCATEEAPDVRENPRIVFGEQFRGQEGREYAIHVDLALNHDHCGLAMAHQEKEGVIKVDLMLDILPSPEIDFAEIRGLIRQLRNRDFKIELVSFDGWESIDSCQRLANEGFQVKRRSVNLSDYELMKELMNSNRLRYYPYEPFLRGCAAMRLRQGKMEHCVDIVDAVAGAVSSVYFGFGKKEKKRGFLGVLDW